MMQPQRSINLPEQIQPLSPPSEFARFVDEVGVVLEPDEITQLGHYLGLLAAGNDIMNLTAITEPQEMWLRHVGDSLTLLPLIEAGGAARVVDIGSGGGVPAIPLAITMPDVHFTLVESTGKKAAMLTLMIERLNLENATVINDRAEQLGRFGSPHREQFDVVTARAVGQLPVLLELTVPLVRVGGFVLAIKGQRAAEEVEQSRKALHLLHSRVTHLHDSPTGTIVVIEKQRSTPKRYPRKPGEPRREPL